MALHSGQLGAELLGRHRIARAEIRRAADDPPRRNNAFIGDAFINSFAARHLALYAQRRWFAKKEPTQHLMDEAVRSRAPHYLPWRMVHLVKVWTFALVLWPVVPLVGVPALVYYLVAFLVDRPNMLRLIEPLPPSSGLCMRFVLGVLMPAVIPVHLAVGVVSYTSKLRTEEGTSLGSALADAKVLFYILGGAALIAGMLVEIFRNQRAIAIRRGLMTPWEVFCAAFKSDVGFTISSAAEPLHDDVECSLAELSDVQLRTLYQPPLIARESDAALRDTFADVMGSSFLFTEMPSHGVSSTPTRAAATERPTRRNTSAAEWRAGARAYVPVTASMPPLG